MFRNAAARGPIAVALLAFILPTLRAADAVKIDPTVLEAFPVRSIGPCNMGGRIVDVAVVESNPATMYVATASGGLWKTTNGGDAWTPVFDDQAVVSLGDVAVGPSNPDVGLVGAREGHAPHNVSWGDGGHKTTDGGQSGKKGGRKDSVHKRPLGMRPAEPP